MHIAMYVIMFCTENVFIMTSYVLATLKIVIVYNVHINYFFFIDINECNITSPCQQTCTNTLGSYQCSCNSGYTVDGTRCNG